MGNKVLANYKILRSNRIKNVGVGDWAFVLFVYSFLIVAFTIVLYPMVFVISASLSDPGAVSSGKMILWPVGLTFAGYRSVMQYTDLWLGYGNTIYYTVAGTFLNLAATLTCAYALAHKDLAGRKFILMLFIFTMYFSGGMIPSYLNVQSLGLNNTRAYMLIGGLVGAYYLIVSRTYFATAIPAELQEAAIIDGCSDFKLFMRIVLPLSMPIIAVMILYYGVGHWNSYFEAMIYLRDRELYPLQLFLREILVESKLPAGALEAASASEVASLLQRADTANLIKYGVIVVSTVPIMVIYPTMQKFFAKGIMIGSLKG